MKEKIMNEEKKIYLNGSVIKNIYKILSFHPDYLFYKAVKISRKYRNAKENKNHIKIFLYGMIVNRIASKYNLVLYGKYGKNLKLGHGNIVFNANAVIGDNCIFHGNNCVGEDSEGKCPKIGNNVEVGFGATIIGNITIADNCVIGANTLVNKSFLEEGVVIAGCPAKRIK